MSATTYTEAQMIARRACPIGYVSFSDAVRYLNENARSLPTTVVEAARVELRRRVTERWQAGRADRPLNCLDIVEPLERRIGGL